MKSQVAWVKKKIRGGLRVDSWKLASAAEIERNGLDLCWQKTWDKLLSYKFTGCYMHTHMYSTHHSYINTITHRDNYKHLDIGMLEAVDGSFEVPTAEVVTLYLLLSIGGSPCDFTLVPAKTPPHTRPTIPLP